MGVIRLPVTDKLEDLAMVSKEYAEKLMAIGGDATGAVASFVQNFERLPMAAWREGNSADWEEKAKLRRQKVQIGRLNDICHEVYTRVAELMALAERNDATLEEKECWKLLAENEWSVAACAKAANIKQANKPLLRESDFGAREFKTAALLNEDRGYLAGAGEKPFELTSDFVSLLGADADLSPARLVEIEKRDGEVERVIIQDCIRTFSCLDHQQRLERFLNGAYIEFGNYSQGMAHVAAFLLLTMTEDSVIAILRKINKEFIVGHWKAESDGFCTNAYVFQHIVEKHNPELNAHFMDSSRNLLPEMYTRKWFCGLGLHCLNIELVFRFLRNLLNRGFEYLISFGMACLQHLKPRLLDTDEIGPLLQLLALDAKNAGVTKDDQLAILKLADDNNYSSDLGSDDQLDTLRKDMYETHLRVRMEKAAAARVVTDDDKEFCQTCDNGQEARWVNEETDDMICDLCKPIYEAKGHEITEW